MGLPTIGTRIRYIGRKPGNRCMGLIAKNGTTHWLCGGAEGEVVRIIKGYSRHRCPDHDGGGDCICGGEAEWIEAQPPAPVVDYACACGETVIPRCIDAEDEGKIWERA